MEQTIGKRIMTLRKSRSMTQEQLAEQLGVSAQAVSKWENDISCPDINLLPKLAAVFQVTTDSLLGVPLQAEILPAPQEKHNVRVNTEDEECDRDEEEDDEEDDDDDPKAGFTLQFDISKQDLPWFATAVLLFAVGLLLNRTLLAPLGEAGIWDLIWPSVLLAFGLSSLWEQISLWAVGLVGFGGYSLLSNMHILGKWSGLNWKIVLPVLLVLWAISLFTDHFREKTADGEKVTTNEYRTCNGEITYDAAFCSETVAVTEPTFRGGNVDISFGNYTMDLTACETVDPGSKLVIDVSFGSVTLLLPKHWKVQERTDRTFSSVSTHGSPAEDADQLLVLECDLSFGTLDIQW